MPYRTRPITVKKRAHKAEDLAVKKVKRLLKSALQTDFVFLQKYRATSLVYHDAYDHSLVYHDAYDHSVLLLNGKVAVFSKGSLVRSVDGVIAGEYNVSVYKVLEAFQFHGVITRNEGWLFRRWIDGEEAKKKKAEELESLKAAANRYGFDLVKRPVAEASDENP